MCFDTNTMDRRGSEPLVEPEVTKFILQSPNYGSEILALLNALRLESSFTDAILCVQQEEFPCHRNVLAVSSPYFKAMFSCDLKESHEVRITFNEVSPWTLKRVIDYVYSGRLEITQENVQDLLAAGSLFEYPAIVNACCEFLIKQLHPSNCLGIEHFAQLHACTKLQDEAKKFTLENFTGVVEHEEFLHLNLERLILYIRSDLIDVRNEETVYEAVNKWLKFDIEERQTHLLTLLEQVRLPIIDISYLKQIETDPLICSEKQCIQLVKEAQKYHESIYDQHGKRRRSMQNSNVHPRPSTVAKEVFVVVGGLGSDGFITKTVEMYDPQRDRWMPLPDLPKAVTWYSMGVVSNSILVTGGVMDNSIVSTVWKFDVVKRVWSEIAPMNKPRARHASAVLDDRLYVIGGMTYESSVVDLDSIECYNPANHAWTTVGHSRCPRKQAQIIAYHNTLIEVGGLQTDVKVATMDTYLCDGMNIVCSGEQYVLPDRIEFAKFLTIDGIFYIIWEDTKKVIALDPKKRTFRKLANMNYAHVNSGAAVLNNKIYICGGLIDSKPSKIVECFDPVTNVWTKEKFMTRQRYFHGCATVQMSCA